ncbi:hypothetical protein FRC08_013980 [Ceratobasidium sp. 394]|nr:hypothetical protein FRC08_013980 [Ceratobasidium sp. 394]
MQREGLIQNNAALRALCEGLETEMFGAGGYDGFVASVIRNFKDKGYAMDHVGGSAGDASPKCPVRTEKSPGVAFSKEEGKGKLFLFLSSQGASVSISLSDSMQSRGLNDVSPPETVKAVAGESAVPSPHEEQCNVVTAEVADRPMTPLSICSPGSQASQPLTIASTVHDSTPSLSLLPSSPSHSSCSDHSSCFVDYMIEQI